MKKYRIREGSPMYWLREMAQLLVFSAAVYSPFVLHMLGVI